MILHRLARNVTDLAAARQFYQRALGCVPLGPVRENRLLAGLLGASHAASLPLRLGAQWLELTQCIPPGRPYPLPARADDLIFQHIAIVTRDITAAAAQALRAGASAISHGGPQTLPASAGGVTAWKFRDPDGHPLEFLQFPASRRPGEALILGYDHSALSVNDTALAIGFYEGLGLKARHRQHNHGPAQNRLDGLAAASVEVVTLEASGGAPHIELLGYHARGKPQPPPPGPRDIAADRLVFRRAAEQVRFGHDPDGHAILCGENA